MITSKPSVNGHGRNGRLPIEPFVNGVAQPEPAKPAAGRGAAGRFAVGNRGGPGNPHARRVAALRQAFLAAATPEKLRQLADKVFEQALAGDLAAAKLFLSYNLGRPGEVVDPDGLDASEWELSKRQARWSDLISFADDLLPPAIARGFLEIFTQYALQRLADGRVKE